MTVNDTMSFDGSATTQNGASNSDSWDFTMKAGLAQMLKGGVIMDVVNAEQVCTVTYSSRLQPFANPEASHRLALPKRQEPALSWPLNESPPTSAAMVV